MGAASLRFRRLAAALVPALALIGTTSLPAHAIAPAPPNAYLAFNEYAGPASSQPFDIITGPDGNIWYTVPDKDEVVKASPVDGTLIGSVFLGDGTPSCAPTGITIGPDHNIWTACFSRVGSLGAGLVVRIIPSSLAQKGYQLPGTVASRAAGCTCPEFLTPGPDGYLWFGESGPGYISKLNVTTGALHRYALPAGANASPRGIAVGSDGNIWFTEPVINRIGRMTTAGALTTFAVPTPNAEPWAITPAPDGNLYYTEISGNSVGRIHTFGGATDFTIPTPDSGPRMINVGPDGNLWFAELTSAKIGSMTLDGVIQDVAVPTAASAPFGVATGPDGNLWFTETSAANIGKVGTRHTALTLDSTGIGFGNISLGATTAPLTATLTNQGADMLAAFTPSLAGGGAGGVSGNFASTGETCSVADMAGGVTCQDDVDFTATTHAGTASSRLDFLTDAGTPYQQKLSVGLSATVNSPSCTSVAIIPESPSPQAVGVPVGLMGTASGCPDPSPLYRFYLRSPAGVWSIVRDFTTDPVFAWDTTNYKAGTYLTGVWVKDALSTKTYDAYAFGTFTLTFPNCTSANLTSDIASPQAPGPTVTFTATSLGCPNPLYQWWVRNAAGVWHIAVAFAAGTTFAWNTTGLPKGTYQVGIWAKQVGSPKSYDAFAFVTYTLTVVLSLTRCWAVEVAATPASPQSAGTAVTLDAFRDGCDNAQYRWWVRDTAAVWHMVQDYNVIGSTFNWSTASLLPGTYLVGVWGRQIGSTASYEAYSFITYTLTIAPANVPCSAVGISPDVASPQAPGATITFTGAALDCPSPTYQFFVAPPPTGVFGVVQAFGASNTFAWNTTGLAPGPYQIGVWARNAGSTKSYEAFAFITFQLSAPDLCSTLSVSPTAHGFTVNNILSQSPQPTGTLVTWKAVAACGTGTAEYQFYVQGPGSTYHVLRSYGATATAAWTTAGLPRGNYNIKVLARSVGATSAYDVFAITTYELV